MATVGTQANGIFRDGSKAAWVIAQGLDTPVEQIIEAGRKAGHKLIKEHVHSIRSNYRRKLADMGQAPGKAGAGAAVAVEASKKATRGGSKRMTEEQANAAMSGMERELIRLALEIGFSRAALIIDQYRERLAASLNPQPTDSGE